MEYHFSYAPSSKELILFQDYYNAQPYKSFEQHPQWQNVENYHNRTCFFYAFEHGAVKSFCKIFEKKTRVAEIYFGPLCSEIKFLPEVLVQITNYYKKRFFACVIIQLGQEYAESDLGSFLERIKYRTYNSALNWATIQIDLNRTIEEIQADISNHHKKEIKKAVNNGLYIKPIENEGEIFPLAQLHEKMYKRRHLSIDAKVILNKYLTVFRFIQEQKSGFILGIYKDESLLGSVTIIYQGKTAFYYMGSSDPDQKKLPVSYIGLMEALRIANLGKIETFDLGGYALNATENDQVYHINWFKKGFGGNIVEYPATMYFVTNSVFYWFLNLAKNFRNKIRNLNFNL